MRINNNIAALNTHRQMTVNTTNNAKSMEKLSSGLRINRAGMMRQDFPFLKKCAVKSLG